jgi:organic radical activating enzyme
LGEVKLMIKVPGRIGMHITHACNFTCQGCLDFTNHGHSGMISVDEGREWMSYWNKRIIPEDWFALLGGEPTLHKDLVEYIYMTREMWPNIEIKLITNGSFLNRHPELPKALKDTDTTLAISLHHDSEKYQDMIRKQLNLVVEWKKEYDIRVFVERFYKHWNLTYKGFGNNIMPFDDNNPEESWKYCAVEGKCFQLNYGKIYKCPPLAHLPMQAEKYQLSEKWDPYLKYVPLHPECSDEEIVEFFNRKAESVCAMCPAYQTKIIKEDPMLPISYWEKKYQ